MRRYWQPAALSEELPPGRAPLTVTLFGEELVMFRDDQGRVGLLGLHCAHRGADLSYGRLEDGGLRCIYHGWLYDIKGRVMDMPAEIDGGARIKDGICHLAYPCIEKAGIILAYLGPGEPPLLPNYDFLTANDDHVFATKLYTESNYLQGNEGNIDLIHNNFVHFVKRKLQDMDPTAAKEARERFGSPEVLSGRGPAPGLETAEAQLFDYGVRIYKIRKMQEGGNYIRVATFILPNLTVIPAGNVNWHVPIDDTHHWKYIIRFDREKPIDKERARDERLKTVTADYRPVANKSNRYLQDRQAMKIYIYSGISPAHFQSQDLCPVEGAGPVQDRTQEHLVANDVPIVISRKLLLKAMKDLKEGQVPRNVVYQPERNRFPEIVALFGPLPAAKGWKEYCNELAAQNQGWQTRQR
jgi:phenylpropionate dioxygenase-like ring-hydroxylating dioxygenase large terminal subunit